MAKERKELMDLIHEIMWHMRGGLNRDDAWCLSPDERNSILEDIKKRVENVEKTQMPLL
jgi:hypothetical protein